jgi:hypothetical protein
MVQALGSDGDAEARLAEFTKLLNAITFTNEAQMRMALKVYLDTWFQESEGTRRPEVREGRRMRWLEAVLEPARRGTTPRQWRRLQAALALTLGTDSMVIMKDVCRLDDEEAQEVLKRLIDPAGGGTGASKSSLCADLRNRRRTEVDTIYGRVAELGRRHGVPTPTLDTLIAIVKGLESHYLTDRQG